MGPPDSTRSSPEAFVATFLSDSGIDEVAILFSPLRRNPSAYCRPELLLPLAPGKTHFQCSGRSLRGLKTIIGSEETLGFYTSANIWHGAHYGLGTTLSPGGVLHRSGCDVILGPFLGRRVGRGECGPSSLGAWLPMAWPRPSYNSPEEWWPRVALAWQKRSLCCQSFYLTHDLLARFCSLVDLCPLGLMCFVGKGVYNYCCTDRETEVWVWEGLVQNHIQ